MARALAAHSDLIERRTRRPPAITAIAIRRPDKPGDVPAPASLFTDDPWEVEARSDVEIIVEVMWGNDPAGALIETQLATGKHVVTALAGRLVVPGPGVGGVATAGAILGDLVGVAAAVVEHSAVENAVVAK